MDNQEERVLSYIALCIMGFSLQSAPVKIISPKQNGGYSARVKVIGIAACDETIQRSSIARKHDFITISCLPLNTTTKCT
jgi:hypothetical protein